MKITLLSLDSYDGRLFRRWDEAEKVWKPLGDGELLIARRLGDVRAQLLLG